MRGSARTLKRRAYITTFSLFGNADFIGKRSWLATEPTHLFNLKWSSAMKRIDLRKTLSAAVLSGGPIVATSALAQSQGGYGMMGSYGAGWMGGGGYGGMLLLLLLVAVVAGLVAWIVARKKK
jgi:uncharacterized membrane protein